MGIPENIIEILHDLNCEEVAKKFGIEIKNHMAHCFKHEDRKASLGFKNNHWKCFSCDIGGDAITFTQEFYSVSFIEACIILAEEYKLPIPYIKLKTPKWVNSIKRHHSIKLCNESKTIFDKEVAEFILSNTILSETGIDFLLNKRSLKKKIIEYSRISGLDEPETLRLKLLSRFSPERLINSKVLKENKRYLTIDTPALIIPYFNEENILISLQTRYIGPERTDSPIPRFKMLCCSQKRLYNIPCLKNLKRGSNLYITEGITDCLALQSAGYESVALPSSTSFPLEDLIKLKDFNLYMVPDNDKAGWDAYIRLYRFLLRYGCELKRIDLPYIRKDYSEYYLKSKTN